MEYPDCPEVLSQARDIHVRVPLMDTPLKTYENVDETKVKWLVSLRERSGSFGEVRKKMIRAPQFAFNVGI